MIIIVFQKKKKTYNTLIKLYYIEFLIYKFLALKNLNFSFFHAVYYW